jgi:hypothetical protein
MRDRLFPDFALRAHPGLYGDVIVKRGDWSGHASILVSGMEREVRMTVLASRRLPAAPGRSRGQGGPEATAEGGAQRP